MTRIIIFAILFYILYRIVKSLLSPSSQKSGRQVDPRTGTITDEMVSDPQCHVYIPKHDAIKTKVAGKTLYFCSKECKKKYLKEEHEPE